MMIIVPEGSTVEQAYLYSSTYGYSSAPTIVMDGVTIGSASFTALGPVGSLQAYRADVTTQVAAKVGTGSAAPFAFSIDSESPQSGTDGEVLAVVYSNPAEVERTIAFLDGGSAQSGDVAIFSFADPLDDPTAAGFEALMSLGIGFSYQESSDQYSIVDVNGQRMTTWAGGEDDGEHANSGLITVGGYGDSTALPANPYATPVGDWRYDDELYDVKSFLTAGDTQFRIDTRNPSYDDNIFFFGLNVTAVGEVDDDDDNEVIPEPTTLALLGFGLAGTLARRRRRK
jgi:hypothetical protein